MRLIRSLATISLYTIGSRIVGFLRTILMATFIGAGSMGDALTIAIKFPSVLRRIFAEGAFNAAFIPIFAGMLAKDGADKARSYAEEIFSILVLSLSILVLVAEVFMPWGIKLILPGFVKTPDRFLYTVEFTRITFPFILFISVCALFSGILNSLERFSYAASSPMMGNVSIIATVFLLKPYIQNIGNVFSISIAVCGIVQALWVMIPAWKKGMGLRLKIPTLTPEVKKFFKNLLPAAAGAGVVQINIFLDMLIGSFLPAGGISYLEYADRLNQLPLSTIGVAMGTALLPMLSKQLRLKEYSQAHVTQNLALEYALFLAAPATLGLCILAFPISEVVYLHGKMTLQESQEIGLTLMAFSLGLPAYIMIKIFASIFFAYHDTKTPVLVAIIAMVINLTLNLLLIKPLQHLGLALSTAIAAWVNAFLLLRFLTKKDAMILNDRFKQFLPKLLVINTLTGIVLIGSLKWLWPVEVSTKTYNIFALSVIIILGLAIYLCTSFFIGIIKKSDFQELKKNMTRSKTKPKTKPDVSP